MFQRHPRLISAAVLALLVLLSLGISLRGEFVWDDAPLIVDNSRVKDPGQIARNLGSSFWETGDRHDRFRSFFRPVVSLSYAADYAVWGATPFGFHLTNLLLHFLCCWLVWLIAVQEKIAANAALVGASLFAVHPVHVESVAWISGRTDLLCGVFVLAAFFTYRRAPRTQASWWHRLPALILFALALFSKEMAATLPGLVFAERWLATSKRKGRFRAAWSAAWPFLLVLTLCLVVRARVLGPGAEPLFTLSAGPWIATIALVVARYVTLLMLPLGLDAHYPYPPMSGVLAPMALTAATMIVVLVIGISLLRKRSPRGLFWAAWIFVTLAPVMALGRFGDVLMADRFLYLPSVGLSLLAALFVAHLIETEASPLRVRALAAFCVVLVLGWGAISFQRARVWKDNLALFSDMVETSPESALVRNNLGLALYERGDTADALEEFELAVRLSPGYALAHNNLGAALEREGRSTEALQHYRTALELAPGHVDAAANAGNLLVRLGRRSEGLRLLHELAKQHPGSTNALYARADALNRAGRPAEALSLLERVRKIDPAHPETHYLLGKIRFEEGRVTEAASSMRRFLELWDDEGPHAEAARRVIGQAQTPAGG